MGIEFKAFWLPKHGNSAEEYEDAFAADGEAGRFAIADGASESSFAAAWARLLVQGFIEYPAAQPENWPAWLPGLQERWRGSINGTALPWYAEAKLEQGAFATFLGMVLEGRGWRRRSRWSAIAVGDSCFFQIRDGSLQRSFPVTRSTDFSNQPWLVGSRTLQSALLEKNPFQTWRGHCKPGDRLWLMTDALAQWFLAQCESGKAPWTAVDAVLAAPEQQAGFRYWIEELRAQQGLRNDDVTLLAVQV
jgi:hypothetical protein